MEEQLHFNYIPSATSITEDVQQFVPIRYSCIQDTGGVKINLATCKVKNEPYEDFQSEFFMKSFIDIILLWRVAESWIG